MTFQNVKETDMDKKINVKTDIHTIKPQREVE